ncbi:uncharacterized protein LOC131246112 [Magnolia sinica]|uniref:uncharacterized protein LOC131246112 n=1 Tax=Magnolia sinica TaxID=86752 RepID=UPI002659CD96|nr:uncharacterized protein LOC131246112 [Magnolia sinica]
MGLDEALDERNDDTAGEFEDSLEKSETKANVTADDFEIVNLGSVELPREVCIERPLSLKNKQRMMEFLKPRLSNFAFSYEDMPRLDEDLVEMEVYVDDMIIKSRTIEGRFEDLKKLFDRLEKFKLRLNLQKCIFGVTGGKLLGFIVNEDGIRVDETKTKAIIEMPPPKTKKEIWCFLGADLVYQPIHRTAHSGLSAHI